MSDHAFEAVRDGGGKRLRLVGELDLASVARLRAAIAEMPSNGALTLDLSDLTYIDSTGLHAIVECANSLNGTGPVRIANPASSVRRVFEIVNLDHHPNLMIESDGSGE
jgi:stage II sporulation protein AA (anti-sigma F factor antagonist)